MPPMSSAQKTAVTQQFIQLTGASERTAQRLCKSAGYKLNEAIDAYFSNGGGQAPAPSANDAQLEKMFEGLRSEDKDRKDAIGVESSMAYLSEGLKVNLENASLFVALELFQSPSIGEITKQGYINGWKLTGTTPSRSAHASYLKTQIASLSRDSDYFKKVYRYAFVVGKDADQKALSLENALIFWGMLFAPPGMEWKTASYDWLGLWNEFLNAKWTRSVNRDMWNMTLEFALKTQLDETLSFWSEDGAWPSVIDSFVAWCKEKGIGATASQEGQMDTTE